MGQPVADAVPWLSWIADHVEATDVTLLPERPWATVARVATATGPLLYFKAQGGHARIEPILVTDIAQHSPGLGPDVVAADLDRGWLLLADHGTPTQDSLDPAGQVAVFEEILPHYARLQRDSPPLTERWIAAGAPDRRVRRLPELLDRLLSGELWGVVPPVDHGTIAAAVPDLIRVCDELAETPPTLDHCDMHGGNVLIGHGTPRLIDWGDACVTHPFTSLFVTYQHTVAKLPPTDQRAAALRLRDIYLEAWRDAATETFAHATWLGHLVRALSFVHMCDPSDPNQRDAVAQFLTRWADQRALLGRPDELVTAIAAQTE